MNQNKLNEAKKNISKNKQTKAKKKKKKADKSGNKKTKQNRCMQFNLSLHFTYELDIYIYMATGLPILEEKVIKYLFVKNNISCFGTRSGKMERR